ncbi:hypothetical protein NUSPORA_01306 [Nucleospora cyclopteri]
MYKTKKSMNSLDQALSIKKKGINGMNYDEDTHYTQSYLKKNSGIINKYFGFIGSRRIKKSYFWSIFYEISEIQVYEKNLTCTKFKFCEENIYIPKTLDLISETILSKKFDKNGLFRVNSTKQRLRTASALLYDIVEQRVNVTKGKQLLDKNFDLIDCCELYKELLRSFNTTIIPKSYIDLIVRISDISNIDDKIICCKAIYYSLPKNNRSILESNIFVCYKICEKMEKSKTHLQQMDLDGISIVMMPNLFLEKDQDIEIEKVLVLVEFCKYFYSNFPLICQI